MALMEIEGVSDTGRIYDLTNYEYTMLVGDVLWLEPGMFQLKKEDGFNLINAAIYNIVDDTSAVSFRSLDPDVVEEIVTTAYTDGKDAVKITAKTFGVTYIIAEYVLDEETYYGFLKINVMPLPEKDGDVPSITYPQVGAGKDFTVVLRDDGTVWTFGYNSLGRLGLGADSDIVSSTSPKQVTVREDALLGPDLLVKKIAVGASFTLALTTEGKVFVWGDNMYGQLGFELPTFGLQIKATQPQAVLADHAINAAVSGKGGNVAVIGAAVPHLQEKLDDHSFKEGRIMVHDLFHQSISQGCIQFLKGCVNGFFGGGI